jgi:hypothetical protein
MPYRDERKALEGRRSDLARQLAALEPDAAPFDGVVREADALRRTIAALDQRIARAGGPGPLPLEHIRIASPCHAAWDAMEGDDRVRFCGSCQKNVYNLSSMSRAEAEALVTDTEGRICVRFYRRADGTVLTNDCPVGQRKRRRRLAVLAVGASALAAAGGAFAMSARPAPPHHDLRMGAVAAMPPPHDPPMQGQIVMPVMGEPAPVLDPPPAPETPAPAHHVHARHGR